MKRFIIGLIATGCIVGNAQAMSNDDFDTLTRLYLHQAVECNRAATSGSAPRPCFIAAAIGQKVRNGYNDVQYVTEEQAARIKLATEYVQSAVSKIKGM